MEILVLLIVCNGSNMDLSLNFFIVFELQLLLLVKFQIVCEFLNLCGYSGSWTVRSTCNDTLKVDILFLSNIPHYWIVVNYLGGDILQCITVTVRSVPLAYKDQVLFSFLSYWIISTYTNDTPNLTPLDVNLNTYFGIALSIIQQKI